MKPPVDPAVLELKQERNKQALQAAFSTLGLVLVVAAFSLCLWLAWGSAEALVMVALFVGVIALLAGCLCVMGIIEFGARAIEFHNSYRFALNQRAWNAQQEELARLRTIMKEEGL